MKAEESPIPGHVDHVDCPDCQNAEPATATKFARPIHLRDRAQVLAWKDLQKVTDRKHGVDPGGIVATYQLTKTTKLRCSLGHEHAHGAIVLTRCGLTMLLGWKCAQNAVHGSDELRQYAEESEAYLMKLDRVKRIPVECYDKLTKLVARLAEAQDFKTSKWDTDFGWEMRRRATGSARDAEVTYNTRVFAAQRATDLGAMNTRDVEVTESIVGLSFWTSDLGLEAAQRALLQAQELASEAGSFIGEDGEMPEPDDELLAYVNRQLGPLQAAVTRAVERVELCSLFLGQNNQRLARIGVVRGTGAERGLSSRARPAI